MNAGQAIPEDHRPNRRRVVGIFLLIAALLVVAAGAVTWAGMETNWFGTKLTGASCSAKRLSHIDQLDMHAGANTRGAAYPQPFVEVRFSGQSDQFGWIPFCGTADILIEAKYTGSGGTNWKEVERFQISFLAGDFTGSHYYHYTDGSDYEVYGEYRAVVTASVGATGRTFQERSEFVYLEF